MTEVKTCATCKNVLFDSMWGEYICYKKESSIRDISKATTCQDYEKSKEEVKLAKGRKDNT